MDSPFLISCCSIALRSRPISEALEMIAEAGFSGVEVWYPHVEKLGETGLLDVKEQCSRLGLVPTVIAPYFYFTRGREPLLETLRTAEAVVRAARALGIPKVRTFTDCGPDGLASGDATPEDWRAARDGLRELCALDPRIDFVVETHEHTLADSLPSVRRLLDEVAIPNLRLNYQPTAAFLERGFFDCLKELFPFISHLHWEQVRPDGAPGYIEEEGEIDFPALIELLLSMGYRGTASVEYCWSPVEESRLATAARYLDGLFRRHLAACK